MESLGQAILIVKGRAEGLEGRLARRFLMVKIKNSKYLNKVLGRLGST